MDECIKRANMTLLLLYVFWNVSLLIGQSCLQGMQSHEYLIGSIGVSGKTKWDVLDGVIRRLFKVNFLF